MTTKRFVLLTSLFGSIFLIFCSGNDDPSVNDDNLKAEDQNIATTVNEEARVVEAIVGEVVNSKIDIEKNDSDEFVSIWSLSEANKTIVLPIYDGLQTEYDFTIDWGDGTVEKITSFDAPEKSHTYATAGEKEIRIKGTVKGFNFSQIGDSREILKQITSWGTLHFGFDSGVFLKCTALESFPKDSNPDLTGITSLQYYFLDCTAFTGNVKNWDISNINDLKGTFNSATKFNEDISGWDVSSVETFYSTFSGADSFTQDISGWVRCKQPYFYGRNNYRSQ